MPMTGCNFQYGVPKQMSPKLFQKPLGPEFEAGGVLGLMKY
jgi:hypothetical protein